MSWKCKDCGGKIIGVYAGYVEVNRLGVAIEGTEYEEGLSHYRCEGCNQVIEWGNLEKYGKWVEED